MRKVFVSVAGLLGVLVIGVLALPFVLPLEMFKDDIAVAVQDATGRSFTVGGKLSLSIIPDVTFEMTDVRLGNGQGFSEADFAELSSLKVQVATLPLLSGKVQIEQLVLERPKVNLEMDAAGHGNWLMAPSQETPSSATTSLSDATPTTTQAAPEGTQTSLPDISLGNVKIVDATVKFSDFGASTQQAVEHLNATFVLANLSSPFSVDSDFSWNGQKFDTRLALDSIDSLVNARATKVDFNVKSKSLVANGGAELTLDLSQAVPSIKANVTLQDVVVHSDRIPSAKVLKAPTATALAAPAPIAKSKSSAAKSASGKLFDLSKEPLDLSGLKAANADVALSINHIGINDIKAGPISLLVALKDGMLDVNLQKLALYSGNVSATVALDGQASKAKIKPSLTISNLRYHELLQDLGILVQVGAELSTKLNLNTSGKSVHDLVANLSGKGNVVVDKAGVIRVDPQTFLMDLAGEWGDKLGAIVKDQSFDVLKEHNSRLDIPLAFAKGMVEIPDLNLTGPLLRAQGKGKASLLKQSLNFHIVPLLVSSVKGAEQAKEERGIRVPFFVRGSFTVPEIVPDEKGLVREAAKQGVKAGVHYAIQQEMQRRFGVQLPENELTNSLVEGLSEVVTSGIDDTGDEKASGSAKTPVSDAVGNVASGITSFFTPTDNKGDKDAGTNNPLSSIKSLFGN